MKYEVMISLRYLFSKKKSLISFISLISVLGVAVGVAALIIVLGVMNGFRHELQDRIVGSNPHIIVEKEGGVKDYNELSNKIGALEDVSGSYPFIWGQGVLRFRSRTRGAVIRSVDLANPTDAAKVIGHVQEGGLTVDRHSLLIGTELASMLGIFIGDEIGVITSSSKEIKKFKVSGIFNSGMYEYDATLVYVHLDAAEELFDMKGLVAGVGVELGEIESAESVKEEIREIVPYNYYVRTWIDMNRNYFSALKLERLAMFIILALIVIVAALNIISTLTIMVTEKTKDIAIMKTIGATKGMILRIFSLQGFIIGLAGILLGAVTGWGLCLLHKRYNLITLPRDIYYISKLPIRINLADSLIIMGAAFLISFVASLYPAYQASRLNLVDALRYE